MERTPERTTRTTPGGRNRAQAIRAQTLRRTLIVIIPLMGVVALLIPLWAVDLDTAARPKAAGPGWDMLHTWSEYQRGDNPAAAEAVEAQLDEIRDNAGNRWLVARDAEQCWTMLTNNPTPLPVADNPEPCDNATPVNP
jgi:hypothetical protein